MMINFYKEITIAGVEDENFAGELHIPEKIDGMPVTKIGNWVFMKHTLLTGVDIPDSVIEIGEATFCGCTSLTKVKIPARVDKIGDLAFAGCLSLTKIEIPNYNTEIGELSFRDCPQLTIYGNGSKFSKVRKYAEKEGIPFIALPDMDDLDDDWEEDDDD